MNREQKTMPALAHPTDKELKDFAIGSMRPELAAEVERHVAECDSCCQTIVDLGSDDTFTDLLKNIEVGTYSQGDANGNSIQNVTPASLLDHPRYEIQHLVGKGGMGRVFKARHRMMDRVVALKVIHQEWVTNQEAVDRFRREMKTAASLDHPNIVTAFDADQADDLHFLAMEFVDGVDLAETVANSGALSVKDACEFIRQAAEGLHYAHQRGMVHRDIKPHNLIVTKDNVVKILDFGLASLSPQIGNSESISGDAKGNLTIAGAIMGTPDFISPEQAIDASTVDGRSDIYSLGMTLYYLLAGQVPFGNGTARDKLRQHASAQPTPLSKLRDDIPGELEDIVSRMTAKDPAQRFQSPDEVANSLRAINFGDTAPQLAPNHLVTGGFGKWLAGAALIGVFAGFFVWFAGIKTTEQDVRDLNAFLVSGESDEPAGDIVRRLLRSEEGRKQLRMLDAKHERLAYADGKFSPGYTAVAAIVYENQTEGVGQSELQVMGWGDQTSGMQKYRLLERVRLDSVRFDKAGDDTTLAKLYFVTPEKESLLGLKKQGLYEGEVEIPGLLGQTKKRISLSDILKRGSYIREANQFELAGKIENREGTPGYGAPEVAERDNLVGNTMSYISDPHTLVWKFTEDRVRISNGDAVLPAEFESEILDDVGQHRVIEASWALTNNQKLRLYDMEVDGKASGHEAVLRISLAGYIRINIGKHQYNVKPSDYKPHPSTIADEPLNEDVTAQEATVRKRSNIYSGDRLNIVSAKPLSNGAIRVTFNTQAESVWVCPGVDLERTPQGVELIFVRRSIYDKSPAECPSYLVGDKTIDKFVDVDAKGKALLIRTADGLKRIWNPANLPQANEQKNTIVGGTRVSAKITYTKLQAIGKALWSYHDQHGHFPARVSRSEFGTPLLSWRVALLPHLGEKDLFARFRLDEPWNSEHNRELILLMPSVFQIATGDSAKNEKTHIVVPVMPGSLWVNREDADRSVKQIKDGTAVTMATFVSPSGEGVIWTKPDDVAFAPGKIKEALFAQQDVCSVGLFDGSVLSIGRNASSDRMAALVTINGGESVSLEDLLPRVSLRAPDPFTKDGEVDYIAFVDKNLRQRVPANEVWPTSIEQWELAAEVPGEDLIDTYGNIDGPWKASDHPKLAEWLADRDGVLNQLVEASKTKACYVPFNKTRESYLALIAPFKREHKSVAEGVRYNVETLLLGSHKSVVSPMNWMQSGDEGQQVRNIVRALRLRALKRIGEGNAGHALRELLAMHRIARLLTRGMPDFAILGSAIETMANYVAADLLQSGQLSKADCQKYLAALSKLPPVVDEDLQYEFMRCQALELLQSVGTKLPAELDDVLKPASNAINDESVARLKKIDWAEVTRVFNDRFDKWLLAMKETDPNVRRSRIESLSPNLDWEAQGNPVLRAIESAKDAQAISKLIGEIYFGMAVANRSRIVLSHQSQLQVIKTALAAMIYRVQNDKYPEDASQLSGWLKAPATDPLDGNPIRMITRNGKLIVYSIGLDLADQTRDGLSDDDIYIDDFTIQLEPMRLPVKATGR